MEGRLPALLMTFVSYLGNSSGLIEHIKGENVAFYISSLQAMSNFSRSVWDPWITVQELLLHPDLNKIAIKGNTILQYSAMIN